MWSRRHMLPSTELLCIWIWMTNFFLMEEHKGVQRFLRIICFWMVVNTSPNLVRTILLSKEEITFFSHFNQESKKRGKSMSGCFTLPTCTTIYVVVAEACRQINPSKMHHQMLAASFPALCWGGTARCSAVGRDGSSWLLGCRQEG